MKVRDLINALEEYDEDADVYIMMQESWPFECEINGITDRAQVRRNSQDDEDWDDEDQDEESKEDFQLKEQAKWKEGYGQYSDRWGADDRFLPQDDVFILEGRQIKYGNKAAWSR